MPGRKSLRRRGIVLDRTKLKEQDLILTMLSLGGEQLRVVAKGARKPGSRLAARTELFCDVDFVESVGRGMGIVSEAQVIDAHAGVRNELDKLSCASAIAEVARFTCYQDVEDPFLHPLLTRALVACEQASDRAHLDVVFSAYAFKVLSHAGWRPVLDNCVACGEPTTSRFSIHAGGVLCESCASETEAAMRVDPHMVGWLAAMVGSTFDVLLETPVDNDTASALLWFAHGWASTHLDVRLRAVEFFAGL
ncbi:MAG: DNA repair protein RecO [Coriobacteriales bacterium]|nr:DNA repair protein RecO [Coriobacteriales bacterium]